MPMDPPVALTVGAHDPLGGAGLAADLPTFAVLGVHGVAVATAVTAQRLGSVDRVDEVPLGGIEAQLDGVVAEFTVAAMKTGLLGRAEVAHAVADRVVDGVLPVAVVDPVLLDGRGRAMFGSDLVRAYRDRLIPAAAVVTPNRAEASLLIGRELSAVDDVVAAAEPLAALGADLTVVTGGSGGGDTAADVIVDQHAAVEVIERVRVATRNVRGSGCTFAAAVAAALAHGSTPTGAVHSAKKFVYERLLDSAGWDLGGGDDPGPISHRAAPGAAR